MKDRLQTGHVNMEDVAGEDVLHTNRYKMRVIKTHTETGAQYEDWGFVYVVRFLDLNRKFGITDRALLVKLSPDMEAQEVPQDEPIFVIRARDRLSLPALTYYKQLCAMDNCTKFHMDAMQAAIESFEDWQEMNEGKMKQPGVTLGKI